MRAPRIVVALALAIVALIGGLWVYNAHRVASVEAPAPATTSAVATTEEAPPLGALGEKVPAAPATVVPAKTPSASDPSASFSTFRGRIIDAATRQPVREFIVEFLGTQPTKKGDEAPGARTFTSDDGRFEWDFLPPGQWAVTISASGYQRFEVARLRLKAGESTRELVVPMRRGHVVRGRVYDESTGVGIAEATVQFREASVGRWEGNFRIRARHQTDENGDFVIDGVPPGPIKLTVYKQYYAGTELDIDVTGNTQSMDIALATGGTITGRLTAADGVTPVSGQVSLFNENTQSTMARPTGDAGRFSYTQLEPGRYQVTGVSAGGDVTRSVALVHGQHIEDLVLAVGTGRSIRGVITGVTPDQLERVRIAVHRPEGMPGEAVRPDAQGRYTITGVTPGKLYVTAEFESQLQLSKEVVLPPDADITLNFEFPATARVSGRVTRAGKPVPSIFVYPVPLEEQGIQPSGSVTSPEGRYWIPHVVPGDYHLYAGDFRSKLLRVTGDTVFDIDIPGTQVSGRVVEAAKVPVVGAHVELWDTNPRTEHVHVQEQTDHFGAFELAGIEPGDYVLTAYKAGYSMYRAPFTYTAPVADLVLALRKDEGVEIRVRDASMGTSPNSIYVVEELGSQNDERHGTRLPLRLDESGVGHLPRALAGTNLSIAADGYERIMIRDWSGMALDLQLTRAKSQ